MTNDLQGTLSGRAYFTKRVGWRWQVCFSNQDGSPDSASGATEWLACSVRYWRQINAERAANSMWQAFNAGVWCANGRRDLSQGGRDDL